MIGNILQKFEKNLSSGFFFFKGMTFSTFFYLGVNSKHFYLANRSAITVKALIGPLSNNPPPFPLNKMAISVKTEGIMC